MNNIKKDLMIFYMFRNGIATFIITWLAFVINLTNYYKASIGYAMQRIFIDNLYTLMYFFMIWILNYLVFEIFKIIIDTFKHLYSDKVKHIKNIDIITLGSIAIPAIIALILFIIPNDSLFVINFCFLLIFMTLRSTKEYYKKIKK